MTYDELLDALRYRSLILLDEAEVLIPGIAGMLHDTIPGALYEAVFRYAGYWCAGVLCLAMAIVWSMGHDAGV